MRRSPLFLLCGLVIALIGCGPQPTPTTPAGPAIPVVPPRPTTPTEAEKAKPDTRDYWKYDAGHFAKGARDAWYEHNAEAAEKSRTGRWEFREVARTSEHVELYDASRAVQLRLTDTDMLARWDKDGKDAEWKSLQKGKWGRE